MREMFMMTDLTAAKQTLNSRRVFVFDFMESIRVAQLIVLGPFRIEIVSHILKKNKHEKKNKTIENASNSKECVHRCKQCCGAG